MNWFTLMQELVDHEDDSMYPHIWLESLVEGNHADHSAFCPETQHHV